MPEAGARAGLAVTRSEQRRRNVLAVACSRRERGPHSRRRVAVCAGSSRHATSTSPIGHPSRGTDATACHQLLPSSSNVSTPAGSWLSYAANPSAGLVNPLGLEKAVADQELARLSRLDRAYNRNLVAVSHTKQGEQNAVDAVETDLPLIRQGIERTQPTAGDAFTIRIDGKTLGTRSDAAEALRAWAGRNSHRLLNLYGYDELGAIAHVGGHDLRARLMPAMDLDR